MAAPATLAGALMRCVVPKLISITVAANEPSLRVMRRLGLRFERFAMHAMTL
jgi:RimJ/RimL family protein N-acetyltransferase